jgi:hypothetical protein
MALGASCIGTPPPPPTLGYGTPYRGTGEGVYVKDSRTDWDITEGHHKITSEQALEASGDPEYEARRQIAKDYNVQLYREGMEHRTRGHHMMEAGGVMAVVGLIVQFVVAPKLQKETITPAMDGMPETRTYTTGFAAGATVNLGFGLFALGVAGVTYGYLGGRRTPPYHVWRTPGPLDRPAYVRQQTEPYNEKIGAPSIPDEDGQQLPGKGPGKGPGLRPPPGVKPPPRMPVMRGGRR